MFDVIATHGNKKLISNAVQAFVELNTHEFISLFNSAGDPSKYKVKKNDTDPQALFLSEISSNGRFFNPLCSEHGEIILQALYAAPTVSNATKAIAMMMIGSTLPYQQFLQHFSGEGALVPVQLNAHEDALLDKVGSAFEEGIRYNKDNRDVEFLIGKYATLNTVFGPARAHQIPSYALESFPFDKDSFQQFLETVFPTVRKRLLAIAPKDFYSSTYILEHLENGFLPPEHNYIDTLLYLYKSNHVDGFQKLLSHGLTPRKHDLLYGRGAILSLQPSQQDESTAPQREMQKILKDSLHVYKLAVVNDRNSNSTEAKTHLRSILASAFNDDNQEEFERTLQEISVGAKRHQGILQNLFMDFARHALSQCKNGEITENGKAMLATLKMSASAEMDDLVSQVAQSPSIAINAVGRAQHEERFLRSESRGLG